MVKRLYQLDVTVEDAQLCIEQKVKFAEIRLKRFCYLGSFVEPVKLHLPLPKIEDYYATVNYHCKFLEPLVVSRFLITALNSKLFRRDEAILVLVIYLLGENKIDSRTRLRQEFPKIVMTDTDLFLFCKYAAMVHKYLKLKIFCKTIKKAIVSWYIAKSAQEIADMFSTNRGRNGFTHRALIRMCHISDYILGTQYIYDTFTNTCTTLQENKELPLPPLPMFKDPEGRQKQKNVNGNKRTKEQEENKDASKLANTIGYLEYKIEQVIVCYSPSTEKRTDHNLKETYIKPSCNTETIRKQVLAISELRTTTDLQKALSLIQEFNLKYEHLPSHLLIYSDVLKLVIPSMTCDQLLRCMNAEKTRKNFCKKEVIECCRQKFLKNKNALLGQNIDPVMCLMTMDEIGIKEPLKSTNNRNTQRGLIAQFVKTLFFQSFGCNRPTNLKVHITINMQNSYMIKILRNTKFVEYKLAALTLAWTFSKTVNTCDIYRWNEHEDCVESVNLPNNFRLALTACSEVQNPKNKQRLTAPIKDELRKFELNQASGIKYDLFLYIVPAATRGNKKQCSELLADCLKKYRDLCQNDAKLVIVDLLRFKQSMKYSATTCENILEICGIDEHTVELIHNFAAGNFE